MPKSKSLIVITLSKDLKSATLTINAEDKAKLIDYFNELIKSLTKGKKEIIKG